MMPGEEVIDETEKLLDGRFRYINVATETPGKTWRAWADTDYVGADNKRLRIICIRDSPKAAEEAVAASLEDPEAVFKEKKINFFLKPETVEEVEKLEGRKIQNQQ